MDLEDLLNRKDIPDDVKEELKRLYSSQSLSTLAIQDELASSQERYRALFERSNDAIFIVDKVTGSYLDANKAAETLTGRSLDTLKTMRTFDVCPKGAQDRLDILAGRKEPTDLGEIEYVHPDGSVRIALLSTVPLSNGQIFGVARDITNRKTAQKILLEKERLSAVSDLTNATIHDFKNTLTLILGNLDLAMIVPSVPKETMAYLRVIDVCTSDAQARIQQLQHFLSRGIRCGEQTPIDLDALIEETIEQAKPTFMANRYEIKVERCYGDVGPLKGNPSELRTAFYNLIKNAVEAMPSGGTLGFETKNQEEDVSIKITDTGIGMDEKVQQKIFEPYNSTKGRGRGFGMASVYAIIRDHEGKIFVQESAPDKGTTIAILLPYNK